MISVNQIFPSLLYIFFIIYYIFFITYYILFVIIKSYLVFFLLYLKIDEKIFEAPSIEFLARRKAVISNEFPNSLLAELLSLRDSILLFFLFLLFFLSSLEKNERANENFRNERNFSSVNRCLESGSRQLSRGIRLRMALVVGEA